MQAVEISSTKPVSRLSRAALIVAACVCLAAWQQANGATDPAEAEGLIFERQQAMKQLDTDASKLGDIVAGLAPAGELAATTEAIAQGARDSRDAFKPQIPGGRSKPEVWANNADFTARMERFASNAEAMAELAKGGNMTAVTSMLAEALPCKECHDAYREPKKK
jgi:cytochrome c556